MLVSTNFLVSLTQIDCNGNESMLSQCPHSDTVCIRPGAGVICPSLVAATTSLTTHTSTPETSQTTQTDSAPEETSQNLLTEKTTASDTTTGMTTAESSSTSAPNETTHTTMVDLFNATEAPGNGDGQSSAKKTIETPFLIAVILAVIVA